jgi:hypothetical protein
VVLLTIVEALCICEGEGETDPRSNGPEELKSDDLVEQEEAPDAWCSVKHGPKYS